MFHSDAEYADFIGLLDEARHRVAVELYAFCIMPNHFHLVLRTDSASDLSAMMQWWLTTHAHRYHRRHGTSGHVWQARFKSFPIQEDGHLLRAIRYVLLNPLRARMVVDPVNWRWSSLHRPHLVSPWPVRPPHPVDTWLMDVEAASADLQEVRRSVEKGAPFGDDLWRRRTAEAFGLTSTLRDGGRPKAA